MGLEAMSPAPSRAAVKQLADERDAVERELAATVDALTAPGGGGLSGPLVDAEGFPRADIDVALVRTRRNRVATLRNDVEALSATLHQRLQEVLAPPPQAVAPAQPPAGAPSAPRTAAPPPVAAVLPTAAAASVAAAASAPAAASAAPAGVAGRPPLPVPFAQVDAVHAASPAAAAGLAAGDLLVSLGDVSVARLAPAAALAALPAALEAAVKADAPLPLRAQSGRRWWSWCSGRARGVAAACSAATSCPSG